MSWFKEITVDHIVSGLGDMVKRLEQHAASKLEEVEIHLGHTRYHNEQMQAASAASERAKQIAGKINALII